MAKRGQTKHSKRIAVPLSIAIHDKKEKTWMTKSGCGPHDGINSVPLGVLLRDILQLCETNKEARKIITGRNVKINGKIRTQENFPVGLMDMLSFEKTDKYFRMLVGKHSRLVPVPVEKSEAGERIGKVTKKYTGKKGEIMIGLHDGTILKADNNIKTGDSLVLSLNDNKIQKILRMEKGAICLVKGGKHAGTIAKIEDIVQTEAGRENEAKMKYPKGEFITVVGHLCVIDDKTKGALNE